jgi:hypothetical protein
MLPATPYLSLIVSTRQAEMLNERYFRVVTTGHISKTNRIDKVFD